MTCFSLDLLLASALLISLNISVVIADEATVERMKEEAPKGWKRIDAFYDGTEFCIETENDGKVEAEKFRWKTTVAQKALNFRIRYDYDQTRNRVDLYSSNYQASISCREDGTWQLEKCEPRRWVGFGDLALGQPSLRVLVYHLPSTILGLGKIPEENKSALILNDAWPTGDHAGNETITAEFLPGFRTENGEFAVNRDIAIGFVLQVDFAPQRDWCVVKVRNENPAIGARSTMEASFADNGFHPIEIRTFTGKIGDSSGRNSKEMYTEPVQISLSESQFWLTAYGLPEPSNLAPKTNYFIWVAGTIVGLVVLLILAKFLKRSFSQWRA